MLITHLPQSHIRTNTRFLFRNQISFSYEYCEESLVFLDYDCEFQYFIDTGKLFSADSFYEDRQINR